MFGDPRAGSTGRSVRNRSILGCSSRREDSWMLARIGDRDGSGRRTNHRTEPCLDSGRPVAKLSPGKT